MRILAMILCALAASTLDWSSAAHAAPPASQEQRLAHISVESIGSGSPVVLIPGLSTPRAVWDGVAPELAKSHRVLLVQVNGFAGDDPGANLSPGVISGAVADLHAWLAKQKFGAVPVVGHSMGGLMALELAKEHPTSVSRVIVVDALPYVGEIFVPGATVAQLEPQAKAMRDQMVASYGKTDEARTKATAAAMAVTPAAQAKVAQWIAKADPRVAGQVMYEDLTLDLRPDMAAITTPITVIHPWSAALPKDRAETFYQAQYVKAPNVSFVAIGEAGHFVMLDQPKAFAEALAKLLP